MLEAVADRLDERAEACRPSSESFVNPAKVLAVDLSETVPVVLGDGPLNGVAASRAASMLARTARMPATFGELPDAASQIVACFDGPFTAAFGGAPGGRAAEGDIFADPFLDGPTAPRLGLLMLRDAVPETPAPDVAEARGADRGDRRVGPGDRREGLAGDGRGGARRWCGWPGRSRITDFAATYLALGLGLDPAVAPHVADLRERSGRE